MRFPNIPIITVSSGMPVLPELSKISPTDRLAMLFDHQEIRGTAVGTLRLILQLRFEDMNDICCGEGY